MAQGHLHAGIPLASHPENGSFHPADTHVKPLSPLFGAWVSLYYTHGFELTM